jgi:hypothetical protein
MRSDDELNPHPVRYRTVIFHGDAIALSSEEMGNRELSRMFVRSLVAFHISHEDGQSEH